MRGEAAIIFCAVPTWHIPLFWPHVEDFISRALKRDKYQRYLTEDVLRFLLEERVRLWVAWNEETKAIDAAAVTEIIDYPRIRELRIWLIGGRNMKTWWKQGLDAVEEWGRSMGCKVSSGHMRKGWARLGGYEITGVSMERAL